MGQGTNSYKQCQYLMGHLYCGALSAMVAKIGLEEAPGSKVAGFPIIVVPYILYLMDSVGGVPGHPRAHENDSCQSFIGLVHV